MARRYDSRTTIFSPEGRLYQVEYAMEAIGNAGSAVGILAKDGVVLAAEKRITSKVRALGAFPPKAELAFKSHIFFANVQPVVTGHWSSWCETGEDVQARQPHCMRCSRHHRHVYPAYLLCPPCAVLAGRLSSHCCCCSRCQHPHKHLPTGSTALLVRLSRTNPC